MGRTLQLRLALCAFFSISVKTASSFSPNPPKLVFKRINSTNLSMGGGSPSSQEIVRAKESIATAISIGAPAYNNGDIRGCAEVYKETALQILPMLPRNLKTNLEATVRSAFADPNQEAWALRRQFDSILGYQAPFVPGAATTADSDDHRLEPFTDRMIPSRPRVVNDDVMGGMSEGEWRSESKTFRGRTSLANNGGFSSLRWRFDRLQNWSYARGIYLRVRHSEPGTHTFSLLVKDATCERVRLSNYKTVFGNPEGTDAPLLIPFDAFDQIEQMGQRMSGGPAFNPAEVTEVGVMAIKPTVVGDFELCILEWGLYS